LKDIDNLIFDKF